jgi:hypothetical protein
MQLFAVFLMVILGIALYRRRLDRRTWVRAERREERGDWLDKRRGERGTYGSLDDEMELARQSVARQGRTMEWVRLIRDYLFEHHNGFHRLSDEQLRTWSAIQKTAAVHALDIVDRYRGGKSMPPPPIDPSADSGTMALKMLDFLYREYPDLLEREVEQLKELDAWTRFWAAESIGRLPISAPNQ